MVLSGVAEADPVLPGLLSCPLCIESLDDHGQDGVECPCCRRRFPLVDGVYDLRVDTDPSPDAAGYGDQPPSNYPAAPRQRTNRVMRRNRLELHILTHMLSGQPASQTLLDVSCRRGRFAGPMQSATRLLIEADQRPQSARTALHGALNPPRVAALACEPDRLPFADSTLDGVVCIRLSHHVATATRRERLLQEALRVAGRFVIFSFSEALSVPSLWRRLRRGPDTLNTMTPGRVRDIAAGHGARVDESVTVSPLGTRHRFTLLVKPSP